MVVRAGLAKLPAPWVRLAKHKTSTTLNAFLAVVRYPPVLLNLSSTILRCHQRQRREKQGSDYRLGATTTEPSAAPTVCPRDYDEDEEDEDLMEN